MVIKSLDTTVADGTMSWTSRPNHFTFWTEIGGVDIPEELKEVLALLWLENTWIFAAGVQEGKEH